MRTKLWHIVRTTDQRIMHHSLGTVDALVKLAKMNDTFRITGLFTLREVF